MLLFAIGYLYVLVAVTIYLKAGGTLGGYGAAAEAGDAPWLDPAHWTLVALCVSGALYVILRAARTTLRLVRESRDADACSPEESD